MVQNPPTNPPALGPQEYVVMGLSSIDILGTLGPWVMVPKFTNKQKSTVDTPALPLQKEMNAIVEEWGLLLPYVQPRRPEALEVKLPARACSSLVETQIPAGVPLLMNIIPKLVRLKFEDNDTHKKEYLERNRYMVTLPAMPPMPQLVVPMEWA